MKKTFTEEELDADDEDQHEEQLQPPVSLPSFAQPILALGKTSTHRFQGLGAKKRDAEALDDAANSDEDLPEVVTMTEGKSKAQQLRSEEKASGRRIAAEVKRKKQERAASRQNDKKSGKLGVSPLKELKAGEDGKDPAQSNMNGLLDDSIVQFLSAREKDGLEEVKLESSPPEDPVKVKRLKSRKEKSNNRVQVIDLSRDLSFVEEHNALDFKHGHLYGNRIKRDPSMLRNMARVPREKSQPIQSNV